jgi:aminopeptidase
MSDVPSTPYAAYQGVIIDDFSITFKDGQAISSSAKSGAEMLNEMIHSCENSDYLGEIALVENSSEINRLNIVFQETLFDENASCHLALGESFSECIDDGPNKTKEELIELGLNKSDNHVDFMIGTEDLSIIGITKDNKKIEIFKDGNFTQLFK